MAVAFCASPTHKFIFPNRNPLKWPSGVAARPGEYSCKTWLPKNTDPLTSDEYIWNKDFMPRFKKLVQDEPSSPFPETTNPQQEEQSAGFLSLTRVMELDRLDVDLSKELMRPSNTPFDQPTEVEAARANQSSSTKWRLAPTRREQLRWDKAAKAALDGSNLNLKEVRKPLADPAVLAAQSREQYFQLKRKLQLFTLGIGGVGLVSAYVTYSPEIAASFGAGLIGSLVYLRMLGTSVDALGDGARGVVKGAVAQPRLLVPVVLVMIYNRWNGILVPNYGYMPLELIPMLVGFFTYKIATFAQAIEDALSGLENKTQT
ncbi:hypothetical protein Tsubulata_015353 [Turnera subulata]|uniref:CGL160/ATPI domain-containing protein n=1 Tax=Turnera subulata TaxID=218843 RepID=A0A9Q0JLG4_9ROSI|nr:hypothetical protein Tsubulata_015353 [Turnera subulata]